MPWCLCAQQWCPTCISALFTSDTCLTLFGDCMVTASSGAADATLYVRGAPHHMIAPSQISAFNQQQLDAVFAASFLARNSCQLAQEFLAAAAPCLCSITYPRRGQATLDIARFVPRGENLNRPGTNIQTPGVSLVPALPVYISHIRWWL
jgi:hypothetical protein